LLLICAGLVVLPSVLCRATLIKTLAELVVTIGGLEDPAACAANVFDRLIGQTLDLMIFFSVADPKLLISDSDPACQVP